MDLLVVRHAIAMEREEWVRTGRTDADRPLTDAGRRRMRKGARGIQRFAPQPDLIVSSPWLRAADTARVLAEEIGIARMETTEALLPDRHPRELIAWLHQSPPPAVVAVVGHEPHLGFLVTWLVNGREASDVVFKKGGACLLRIEGRADAGTATIHWLLTPAQLRAGAT